MKKIFSFILAALMLVSMIPTALAAEVDVSEGTTIKVVGTGADTYTVTVPAKLAPGESGTVKANGTWPSNQTLNVTAPSSVTLTHGTQTMDVGITFDGSHQPGSDSGSVSPYQAVAVASASALFGTWTGHLVYNVEMVQSSTGGDSGTTEPSNPGGGSDELNPDDGTTPANGDVYSYGDYTYTYSTDVSGWKVALNTKVTDKTQTSYGVILESINGEPVTNMSTTFSSCTGLTTAPEIPANVTNMYGTFSNCTNLTTAPVIPDSVTSMSNTFASCTKLTTAPEIPASVTSMYGTFSGCTNLTTAPVIPANVTNMDSTFYNCTNLTTAPEIPASVTSMSSTFYKCTGLTTAPEIPASVTNMKDTFQHCLSLTGEIVIPCSLASKNYTYTNCPATITYYHVDGCDGSCGK